MFDWKQAISTVAPMLGTAIGGPFGGMAAKCITDALGISEGACEEEIEQIIKLNPDAMVKIKKAELKFKARMEELDIKREQLVFEDRDNARKREIALKDSTPAALSIFITCGFFGLLSALLVLEVKNATLLNVMIGSLGTAWVAIVNYYFGSSSSSAKKNDLLARK